MKRHRQRSRDPLTAELDQAGVMMAPVSDERILPSLYVVRFVVFGLFVDRRDDIARGLFASYIQDQEGESVPW